MKRIVRIAAFVGLWMFFAFASAQTVKPAFPAPQSPGAPSLSTADRVAIQSIEKAKVDLQKQFQEIQQQELTILREWQTAHPGWRIDPQTFAISAEAKGPEVKKALK